MGSTDGSSLPLDIKIIGAGVGGLACGLALARKGHRVTIFEANRQLSEYGAGLQLWPNATRIISAWGLKDEFLEVVNAPNVMTVRRYSDDGVIGEIPHNPMAEWEYGYPHWQIYRPDLQALLAKAAEEAGVRIQFETSVTTIDAGKGELTLNDGTTEMADLVIGADGIKSPSRSSISQVKARALQEYCFRAIIPKSKMDDDPETADLMKGQLSMCWVGPGVCMLCYTIAGGDLYNIVAAVPRPSDAPLAKWNEPGDPEEFRGLFRDFCPVVRKVLSYVHSCAKWTLGEVPELESYVSTSGKFVLVGDAAHAMTPHAGQGAAMALEDAAALAEFASGVGHVDELSARMQAYSDFRRPRIENIRRMASGNQKFLTMEDGPEQQQRDALWGAMTAKWKGELQTLGEEGVKAKAKPTADPNAGDIRTPEGRAYMVGYDVVAEARVAMSQVGSVGKTSSI